MGDWQTKVLSFPVLGATSEKFVLAIVLLDALLNGHGHERPIEAPHGRSALYGAPSRAEVTNAPRPAGVLTLVETLWYLGVVSRGWWKLAEAA